jgi:hypothetical protein
MNGCRPFDSFAGIYRSSRSKLRLLSCYSTHSTLITRWYDAQLWQLIFQFSSMFNVWHPHWPDTIVKAVKLHVEITTSQGAAVTPWSYLLVKNSKGTHPITETLSSGFELQKKPYSSAPRLVCRRSGRSSDTTELSVKHRSRPKGTHPMSETSSSVY